MIEYLTVFHATILTIFPQMFPGPLSFSLAGRALEKGIWNYNTVNIRDFGKTKHKKFDGKMYGGSGLVMRPDVLADAIDSVLENNQVDELYYLSPRGVLLTQELIKKMSVQKRIVMLCGRFEGIDERIIDEYNLKQISIGDYILSGGEIAAFTILDSIIRLLPGVIVNSKNLLEESFEVNKTSFGYLEYPLFTKPFIWRGKQVPDVLLSGNHKAVQSWQKKQSVKITSKLRPDLIKKT